MRVVIIGGGIAGLTAARALAAAGADTIVLERARTPGGRMATRRIGAATFDHGAQFFTVRTPTFASTVDRWREVGLVEVWNHGFGEPDGHPRYIAPGGMNSLAKDLATGLTVEVGTMAFAVRRRDGPSLEVVIDDGTRRPADAVISTCPLPQSFSLLVDAGIDFDEQVFRTDYDRTLALLGVLDRPPAMPSEGGVRPDDPAIGFIGDNVSKGVSDVPALTIHATSAWSETNWSLPDAEIAERLTLGAATWLGDASIVEYQVKRWRFATPRSISADACWTAPSGDIVVAGDAFAGPRVEGAHNSGLAAARAVLG